MKTLKLALHISLVLFAPFLPLTIYVLTGNALLSFIPVIVFIVFLANIIVKHDEQHNK